MLTAKSLCKLAGLPYYKYKSYVDNIRHKWKNSLRSQLGSKPHSFHNARAWVYVDRLRLDRKVAVERGWVLSRNRNKALLWREGLGRMEWFETGRVNIFVRKPPTKGRLWQLFCNGFSFTRLIDSWVVLEAVLKNIRTKGAHAVWETGQRQPHLVIDLFKFSNGVKIKLGDLSHPTGIEVEFTYPDWAEKNERLLKQFMNLMKTAYGNELPLPKDDSYIS